MDAALLQSVQSLEHLSDYDTQIACLRRIKNQIVGNSLRKELVITHGLLGSLEHYLAIDAKASGKQASNGEQTGSPTWTKEDEIRLQAMLILDILTSGAAFVSPIMLSDNTSHLCNALVPGSSPSRIIIAALRALNSLAWASGLADISPASSTPTRLALQAFSRASSTRLLALLKTPLHSPDGRQIVHLTAALIATGCTDDVSRATLARAGVLEALGSLLADYAVHSVSKPTSVLASSRSGHLSEASICKVLNAVSAVIKNSDYRIYRLLMVSAFRRTFSRGSNHIGYHTDRDSKKYQSHGVDAKALLPDILATVNKSVTFGSQQFPSLHSTQDHRTLSPHAAEGFVASEPLCAWLIHLARTFDLPSARLAALRLQASVYAAVGLNQFTAPASTKVKGRERLLALLAVPIAVKIVQDAVTSMNLPNDRSEDVVSLREEACDVLAHLIYPSMELQKAAVDAGAIKHVSLMLRKSFDPVSVARPMWSAQQKENIAHSNVPSSQMGEAGLMPEIAHIMKVRAGALRALAALAQREDLHRKAIIDQGMVSYLIDALTPMTDKDNPVATAAKVPCAFNTVPVMISACEAATSMSRSVSLLRTSLIDAGIAKPILALLRHPNSDVQVAATNVCCNLVLDFSPMRKDLMDAGALKTFCDHARRSHPALRVSSLWALKHLVLNAPRSTKIEALDEIGPGWLVQAISGNTQPESLSGTPLGMTTSNAAGEQVDLLNAPATPDMDLDLPESASEAEDSEGESPQVDTQNGMVYQTSTMRTTLKPNLTALSTLRKLRERETDPLHRARKEDTDIQEQAMDIIRNLMNGDESASMIDHLNSAIGLTRIFEILRVKLEASASFQAARNPSSSTAPASFAKPTDSATAPTSDKIIYTIVHIMTHISAASSRHKQLLIAQKPLLRAWLHHFSNPDGQIRTACLWTVINLTWVEDQSDREDARRRAMELRYCGVEDKVRQLQADAELDVRERCKIAIRQLEELLIGGGPGRAR